MNLKELREIIQLVVENDVSEFEYERGGTRIRIRRGIEPAAVHYAPSVAAPAPALPAGAVHPAAGPAEAAPEAAEKKPSDEDLHSIRSPIVGTFYRAPSPGAPPFVKIGDHIEVGTVLCLVEAMKLMNEIESDLAGEVVKIMVENGQPVEYGQLLFVLRPR